MKSASRVLVAMDLTDMDNRLLNSLHYFSDLLAVRKAYFLHVMPDFRLPKDVDVEFHRLFSTEYPVDEKVKDKIALDLAEVFGDEIPFESQVDVREGRPLNKLLHWLDVKEINWLVVGHKRDSEGSGITARRVARHSKCNVLFVPDQPSQKIRNILIPVDFSENSARAIRRACAFKRIDENINIQCLYVIDLPPNDYYLRPVPRSGFQAVLRDSAKEAYKNFLRRFELQDIPMEMNYAENTYTNISSHIHEFAQKQNVDAIIMGAQGHSPFGSFVFGSVTERLVERTDDVPVLVVR